MSKDNNLHDFLTDIADAVREKKGTTEPINAQNLSEEIRSIQSGEKPSVEEKDVNFYDYDGTLLFSYTIPEAQALTELPTPKGHSGLIFDGWNWDYEDVIALDYPMNIGAMYRTDDGATRLYLVVEEPTEINFTLEGGGTKTIDFGDGTIAETSEKTPVIPHRYENGRYVLTIKASSSYKLAANANCNIFGHRRNSSVKLLRKVEIGDLASIANYAFAYCCNLETITQPSTKDGIYAGNAFIYCTSLKWLNVRKGLTSFSLSYLASCTSLKSIVLPNGFLSLYQAVDSVYFENLFLPDSYTYDINFANNLFRKFRIPKKVTKISSLNACRRLVEIEEPNTVVTRGVNAYYNCRALRRVVLSPSISVLTSGMCGYCGTLQKVFVRSNITSIEANAFINCASIGELDFSSNTVVPTLANVNAFSDTTCNFIVPDNLYDEWIVATNWSTYADRIVKASEYQPNNE